MLLVAQNLTSSAWRAIGPFDESFHAYYEDDDYWLRIEECFGDSRRAVAIDPRFGTGVCDPVVIHLRTGWNFDKRAHDMMKRSMLNSKLRYGLKWPVSTTGCANATARALCLRSRKGVMVRRATSKGAEYQRGDCPRFNAFERLL